MDRRSRKPAAQGLGNSHAGARSRFTGIALLGVLLLAAAAVPRLTNPGTSGSAGMLPQFQPRVGNCVVQLDRAVYVVPCSSKHTAEVSIVYPAGGSMSWQQRGRLATACQVSAASYLGLDPGAADAATGSGWRTSELATSGVPAPRGRPGSAQPDPPWRVCLVRPAVVGADGGYVGTIRGLSETGILPAQLRSCYAAADNEADGRTEIACAANHSGEVLATRSVSVRSTGPGSPADDPALQSECRQLAGRQIGTDDVSYQGALSVVLTAKQAGFVLSTGAVEVFAPGNPGAPRPSGPWDAKREVRAVLFRLTCSVQVSAGRQLYGSLVGLGNRPLPVQ